MPTKTKENDKATLRELKPFRKPRGGEYIKLIAIVRNSDKEAVCFVSDCIEGAQYLETLCKNENRSHYSAWCAIHGHKPDNPDTWELYCSVTGCRRAFDNQYHMIMIKYTMDQFCAVMRSVTGRLPVGAPYETPEEAAYKKRLEDLEMSSQSSVHDFAIDSMMMALKETLGITDENDPDLDPVYSEIVDDTLNYLEDRLVQAGYLTDEDVESLHEEHPDLPGRKRKHKEGGDA